MHTDKLFKKTLLTISPKGKIVTVFVTVPETVPDLSLGAIEAYVDRKRASLFNERCAF